MIVALIPARSGSKRVKDKNIRPLGGYPLMAWSIACAKMCEIPAYVSSENLDYLRLAECYGAMGHLRRYGYEDTAKDAPMIEEFTEHISCDSILFLRPTTPLRHPLFLNMMMQAYTHHPAHWISFCKMRDGDFYRNTGYGEVFPRNAFDINKIGLIQTIEVGEIDEEEDFDYIEWRLQKYGSVIYDYLKQHYPNPPTI